MKALLHIMKLATQYQALGFKRLVIKAQIQSEICKLLHRR